MPSMAVLTSARIKPPVSQPTANSPTLAVALQSPQGISTAAHMTDR